MSRLTTAITTTSYEHGFADQTEADTMRGRFSQHFIMTLPLSSPAITVALLAALRAARAEPLPLYTRHHRRDRVHRRGPDRPANSGRVPHGSTGAALAAGVPHGSC